MMSRHRCRYWQEILREVLVVNFELSRKRNCFRFRIGFAELPKKDSENSSIVFEYDFGNGFVGV